MGATQTRAAAPCLVFAISLKGFGAEAGLSGVLGGSRAICVHRNKPRLSGGALYLYGLDVPDVQEVGGAVRGFYLGGVPASSDRRDRAARGHESPAQLHDDWKRANRSRDCSIELPSHPLLVRQLLRPPMQNLHILKAERRGKAAYRLRLLQRGVKECPSGVRSAQREHQPGQPTARTDVNPTLPHPGRQHPSERRTLPQMQPKNIPTVPPTHQIVRRPRNQLPQKPQHPFHVKPNPVSTQPTQYTADNGGRARPARVDGPTTSRARQRGFGWPLPPKLAQLHKPAASAPKRGSRCVGWSDLKGFSRAEADATRALTPGTAHQARTKASDTASQAQAPRHGP